MIQPTAAMLVIGDEILSGRTADKNINCLAQMLDARGIALIEVRIIADDETAIISATTELSRRYDLVFTSGGIGPTHDDITTVSIAKTFDVCVIRDPEADRLMIDHYKGTGLEYTPARQKMADVPEGAALIDNPVSVAPGYRINNVFVLAGVPEIFAAMLDGIDHLLPEGIVRERLTIQINIGEGTLAPCLAEVTQAYQGITIGCYPWFKPGNYGTAVVVSGFDRSVLEEAVRDIIAFVAGVGGTADIA